MEKNNHEGDTIKTEIKYSNWKIIFEGKFESNYICISSLLRSSLHLCIKQNFYSVAYRQIVKILHFAKTGAITI